ERGHRGVAGESRQQCTMGPAELHGFFRRFASEQSIEEAGGITVAAADTVYHIEFAFERLVRFAVDPGDGAPAMAVGRTDFWQGRGHDFDLRMFLRDVANHSDESARIQFGFGSDLGAGNAEAKLQVLFVAN